MTQRQIEKELNRMASILYYKGVDSITISKRLGHTKGSTTTDSYSHIMKQTDEEVVDCIAEVILEDKLF